MTWAASLLLMRTLAVRAGLTVGLLLALSAVAYLALGLASSSSTTPGNVVRPQQAELIPAIFPRAPVRLSHLPREIRPHVYRLPPLSPPPKS